jgi:hypothetical protein
MQYSAELCISRVSGPKAVDPELIACMHALKKMRSADGHQAGDVADVIRRKSSRRRC